MRLLAQLVLSLGIVLWGAPRLLAQQISIPPETRERMLKQQEQEKARLRALLPEAPAGVARWEDADVVAPVPTKHVAPEFPDNAARAKKGGKVVLSVIIGVDGIPREVKVLESAGKEMDRAAIQAVEQWRFQPAQRNGAPIPFLMPLPVSFSIL